MKLISSIFWKCYKLNLSILWKVHPKRKKPKKCIKLKNTFPNIAKKVVQIAKPLFNIQIFGIFVVENIKQSTMDPNYHEIHYTIMTLFNSGGSLHLFNISENSLYQDS